MGLISASTPLIHPTSPRAGSRGPTVFLLLPVPLVTIGVWVALLRSIGDRHETRPFLLSIALFALGYLGLGVSMWPYLVPRHLTIWKSAAPPTSQAFLLVGGGDPDPGDPVLHRLPYWVFRGKVAGTEGYH